MYRLDSRFARGHFSIAVVGCGGTGGFVAEGLCRLYAASPQVSLVLIDPDRVEERNLRRQNFLRDELGRFKAQALATRLARRYGRAVAYSVLPVALAEIKSPGLIIGCVDNGPARRDIAQKVGRHIHLDQWWWVDAGNGENYGQVLIGNRQTRNLRGSFDSDAEVCFALPLPTLQRPELLAQRPLTRDCAAAVETGEQSPAINQALAALVVEVARRLIGGSCPWMQLYLDLEAGTIHPVLATPEAVAKLTSIKQASLIQRQRK